MDLEASQMHGRGSPHNMPRWVKMFGITVIVSLALFMLHLIAMTLLGYTFGGHGDQGQPSSATEHSLQQP